MPLTKSLELLLLLVGLVAGLDLPQDWQAWKQVTSCSVACSNFNCMHACYKCSTGISGAKP